MAEAFRAAYLSIFCGRRCPKTKKSYSDTRGGSTDGYGPISADTAARARAEWVPYGSAEDALAGRQVAVKELRAPDGVGEAERDIFRKRALQEARSAARLAHPNAVILHDIVPPTAADDAVYLIMEYVDGATLAQIIEREGPLSEPRASPSRCNCCRSSRPHMRSGSSTATSSRRTSWSPPTDR